MPRIKISQTNIGSGIPLVPLTTAQAKALPNNTMFLDKSFQLSYKTNQGRTAPILNPTGGTIVPIGVTLLNSNGNAVNPSPWPTIKFAGSAVSVTDVPEFGYSTVTIEQPVGVEYTANKNQPSGYAGLNSSGKIESAQLPSYVDDIEEYANLAALPGTGETGKIYVTLDNNKQFRWSGSVYVDINTAKQDTSEKNQPLGYAGLDAGGLIDFNQLPDLNLGTAANLDVAVSGNAGVGEVVKGDDTRLSDSRTPSAHTIGSHSDYPVNGYVSYNSVGNIEFGSEVSGGVGSFGVDYEPFIFADGTTNRTIMGVRAAAQWSNLGGPGEANTVIGADAGFNLGPTATFNTLMGGASGTSITTGSFNTAVGANSLGSVTTGSRNIAIGTNSILFSNASDNIAIGYSSGSGLSTGSRNIAIGNYTLYANNVAGIVTGTGQIAIGYEALYNANASSSGNTVIGYQGARSLTSGTQNTVVGVTALNNNSTGSDNVSIGHTSGRGISTSSQNIAIGNYSLYGNNSAVLTNFGQIAIGYESLYKADATSSGNTAIGHQTLKELRGGASNTSVGYNAGLNTTFGGFNTFMGYKAGASSTISYSNTLIGFEAGINNTSGNSNTCLGYRAGYNILDGNKNTCIGNTAGSSITFGLDNTCVGDDAGLNISTGINNVCIGKESGGYLVTGQDNVFIGNGAGETDAGLLQYGEVAGALMNAIAVGTNATVDKSNKVQLGNSAVDEMDFSDKLRFTTTAIMPLQTSETVDIGTDDGITPHRFNQINLNSVNLVDRVTDAPTPAAGITLYMMGGDLKFIDSSGTIKTVTAV